MRCLHPLLELHGDGPSFTMQEETGPRDGPTVSGASGASIFSFWSIKTRFESDRQSWLPWRGLTGHRRPSASVSRTDRVLATMFFCLNALYLPVARKTFSAFNCSHHDLQAPDGSTGSVSYLSAAPYIACHTARHSTYKAVAVVVLVFYIAGMRECVCCTRSMIVTPPCAGLPLFFFVRVWPHRYTLHGSSLHQQLGFLWAAVQHKYVLWDIVVVTMRKLAVAALVSLLPLHSGYLPLSMVVLLSVAIIVQVSFKPFRRCAINAVSSRP